MFIQVFRISIEYFVIGSVLVMHQRRPTGCKHFQRPHSAHFFVYILCLIAALNFHFKGKFCILKILLLEYSKKNCVKRPLKNRQNKDLNDKW